jgi:hypothetical protein
MPTCRYEATPPSLHRISCLCPSPAFQHLTLAHSSTNNPEHIPSLLHIILELECYIILELEVLTSRKASLFVRSGLSIQLQCKRCNELMKTEFISFRS